jgi:hypothetical protein
MEKWFKMNLDQLELLRRHLTKHADALCTLAQAYKTDQYAMYLFRDRITAQHRLELCESIIKYKGGGIPC